MIERLPSLNALKAFEAAARHLSFSKAAEELYVTPAAISHQIKGLEDYLGVQLFHRLNRALVLTEAAQAALPKLQEGFACLAEAVQEIHNHDGQQTVTVWAAPSFAAKWLVARLNRFAALHPGIDLQVSASESLIDDKSSRGAITDSLRNHAIDVAIPFGQGEYPDYRVDKLFSVSVVPLCSPSLLEGEHPLRQPEDLIYHTLIHDDTGYKGRPDWPAWLETAGVDGVDTTRGLHFNHVSLALQAAIDGQGVVLSLKPLAADDLAAGRLIIPFDLSLPVEYAYYVICPEATAERPEITAFREWLLDEAGQRKAGQGSTKHLSQIY